MAEKLAAAQAKPSPTKASQVAEAAKPAAKTAATKTNDTTSTAKKTVRKLASKTARSVKNKTVRAAPTEKTAKTATAPRTAAPTAYAQGELLAVDIWDGKPSAVVGTGVVGDRRVRVLQPGEQLHGISLVDADAQKGRATFATSSGSRFTLHTGEGGAP